MNSEDRMLSGPLLPAMISFTIPVILTGIFQLLFNAADLIIVGQFCGSISVAAVGATGAITQLIVNLFMGLSIGAGVVAAQGLGARDDGDVHRTVHTALPTSLLVGCAIAVVGIVAAKPVLALMDTPDNVLPLSAIYMQIYFAGMPFSMVYNFSASILRAAGDTKKPLVYLTVAGVVNVVLNVIFVTVFDLNVAGVALATTISQAVSALLVVRCLIQRSDACRFVPREMHIDIPQLWKIARIGVPAGLQNSMFALSNVIIQSSVNSFGELVMSGSAAANNLHGFVFSVTNAFCHTSSTFVGQNMGAGQFDRIKKIYPTCLGIAAVAGIAAGLAIYAAAEPLLGFYITDSAEALHYGVIRLAYCSAPCFLMALMDVSTGALRGMGASVTPMVLAILGVCVFRIVWVYTIFQIPMYHTPESLFFSYPVSWALTFLAQMIAFFLVFRKKSRKAESLL